MNPMTLAEVAVEVGVKPWTLRRLIHARGLPHLTETGTRSRGGVRMVFAPADVEAVRAAVATPRERTYVRVR